MYHAALVFHPCFVLAQVRQENSKLVWEMFTVKSEDVKKRKAIATGVSVAAKVRFKLKNKETVITDAPLNKADYKVKWLLWKPAPAKRKGGKGRKGRKGGKKRKR